MITESAGCADLDIIFDQDLLCAQTWDSIKVPKENERSTRELVEEAGCAVPVSKKRYVELAEQLVGKVTDTCQKSKGDKHRFLDRGAYFKKLSLKVWLSTDHSKTAVVLQAQVAARSLK